jgi:hypothetical protein
VLGGKFINGNNFGQLLKINGLKKFWGHKISLYFLGMVIIIIKKVYMLKPN